MTVSSEVSVAGPFYGNGTTKTFPYSFKILDAKHIRAVLISASGDVSDLSLDNGDYSVTGVGSETGGDVIKATPLLAGQTLTLVRRLPLTQETSLENQGAYYPEVVERRLDQMVMQIQSVKETTERSLTVEPGQEKPSMTQIAAAQGYSQAAKTSRDEAGQFAEHSADSASDALGSATLAGRWANAPEDQEVVPSPGLFSAFHWYRKTFAIWNSVIAGWSGAVHDAPLKASPSLADEFGFADSGDSWKIKKQTFAKLQEVFGLPIGATIMVQGNGNTPPPGFLLHNGAPCTSAYPQLRAFLLANGAAVNGNGDPIIEDMGGYFPRGWRSGQVVDSGRMFGSVQQDTQQRVQGIFGLLVGNRSTDFNGAFATDGLGQSGGYSGGGGAVVQGNFDNARVARTSTENRPSNKTFTYWIKAYAADQVPGSVDFAALANNVQGLKTLVFSTGDMAFSGYMADEFGAGLSVALRGFKSGNQPYVINGYGSVAHGLGRKPSKLSAYMVCTTAANGWSLGDEFEIAPFNYYNSANYGLTFWADTTNIYWKFASTGIVVIGKFDGSINAASPSNYALRLRGAI